MVTRPSGLDDDIDDIDTDELTKNVFLTRSGVFSFIHIPFMTNGRVLPVRTGGGL